MAITAKDAEKALNDAALTERKTRLYTTLKGSDWISYLWGAIWVVGFGLQHLFRNEDLVLRLGRVSVSGSGVFWFPLIAVALVTQGLIISRSMPVKSERERELGKAIGFMWFSLYMFVGFWIFLVAASAEGPIFAGAEGDRVLTAIYATIPMFALLLMGLFGCGRFLIFESVFITVMTGVGLFVAGEYFFLYMAVVGGGTQIATGAAVHYAMRRVDHG